MVEKMKSFDMEYSRLAQKINTGRAKALPVIHIRKNHSSYQYYDSETNQYHDIYALGMNQLKEYGHHANKNVNVWDNDIYGSLIDVHHADGSVTSGIIMDASSAGNKKANLDQWTEYVDPNNETVTWNFKRIGWGSTKNPNITKNKYNRRRDNMYCEDDMRGMQSQIIRFIRDLLASYSLTPQEVIRMVASEFALAVTRSLIDFVHEQYDKYKNR